jgi:hypothetical protein
MSIEKIGWQNLQLRTFELLRLCFEHLRLCFNNLYFLSIIFASLLNSWSILLSNRRRSRFRTCGFESLPSFLTLFAKTDSDDQDVVRKWNYWVSIAILRLSSRTAPCTHILVMDPWSESEFQVITGHAPEDDLSMHLRVASKEFDPSV